VDCLKRGGVRESGRRNPQKLKQTVKLRVQFLTLSFSKFLDFMNTDPHLNNNSSANTFFNKSENSMAV